MDQFVPQEYQRRRHRNVDLNQPWNKQQTEIIKSHGIAWGNPEYERQENNIEDNLDEINDIEGTHKVSLVNREMALALKDQGESREFVVGGCQVTLGKLGNQVSQGSQKLTVYLDPKLIDVVKELKKAKLITSASWLVSEALQQYLIANSK